MGRAASARQSLEEYLRWESTQTVRHDFWRGEVYAMTGGSLRHNRATLATAMTLQRHLQDTPCQVFVSDVRVAVDAAQHWFYPDVVVTCDPQDLDDPDATALRAPVMVLEVLSPSTAAYDRGEKFLSLQRLPSVREYALLDPARLRLEVFRRNAEGRFEHHVVEGVQAEAELTSIGWRGPLSALLG